MAPSLSKARDRKWWIAITAVLENLMFAAVLLGWSSLLLMLKNEGFCSYLCIEDTDTGNSSKEGYQNSTDAYLLNATSAAPTEHSYFENPTCPEQDEVLNRYFSIGSSLLSAVTVVLGVIMDKYGSRVMRLCGCLTFMVSCVCFAIGSLNTAEYSFLIAPAVCLNGMGGVVYVFTSFQIPNLFKNIRSTMIALMIGSYSSSAVVYMIFKAAYDAGLPFAWIMIIHASIGFLTFINCFLNIPQEPLPGPDDITYAIKFGFKDLKFDHKVSGRQFLHHTSSIGRRMSNVDTAPFESLIDLNPAKKEAEMEPFTHVLMTPCVLLSFVTICITQLRLISYMGWMELYLKAAAQKNDMTPSQQSETVSLYTFIFGLLQINCFFMAPVIGTIMDWKLKNFQESNNNNNKIETKKTKNGNKNSTINKKTARKLQLLSNLSRAYFITNLLLVIFGIIILFEELIPLQVVAFVVHTAIRTFLHSSLGGLYANMYHFSHFGKLTGLSSFLSALFILVQDPLFVVINSSFGGDPFWINFILLIVSFSGFGLPVYLWYHKRKLTRKAWSIESNGEMKAKTLEVIAEEGEDDKDNEFINKHLEMEEDPAVHLSISAITF